MTTKRHGDGPLALGAVSAFDAWVIRHAHQDKAVGLPIPREVVDIVRRVFTPTSADGSKSGAPEILVMSTSQMAERMGCSARWVRHLCETGQMAGAHKEGRSWVVIRIKETHGHDEDENRG
ncbi:hypothetical protein [Streptosporangium amethystogenes]|uniref:hypothetical protein n=1 Tax=Streptosporangium amethystogenes TaxID=2002 RepID=UPI0012F91F8F|nr:hypothetical protein [Streptosporangium amethystogenes]